MGMAYLPGRRCVMRIIGAGMAGLLAAAMLRGETKQVIEANSRIPNNHHSVLRFRSSIVGDVLGIPFKKVSVMRAVETWKSPIADAISYSLRRAVHIWYC